MWKRWSASRALAVATRLSDRTGGGARRRCVHTLKERLSAVARRVPIVKIPGQGPAVVIEYMPRLNRSERDRQSDCMGMRRRSCSSRAISRTVESRGASRGLRPDSQTYDYALPTIIPDGNIPTFQKLFTKRLPDFSHCGIRRGEPDLPRFSRRWARDPVV